MHITKLTHCQIALMRLLHGQMADKDFPQVCFANDSCIYFLNRTVLFCGRVLLGFCLVRCLPSHVYFI